MYIKKEDVPGLSQDHLLRVGNPHRVNAIAIAIRVKVSTHPVETRKRLDVLLTGLLAVEVVIFNNPALCIDQ
jgi:hypothetical protein